MSDLRASSSSGQEMFVVAVRGAFDLGLTVGVLRRLPTSALYPLSGGELRFVARLPSGHRLIAVRAPEPGMAVDTLECVALDGALNLDEQQAARLAVGRMLGVERDLEPLWALFAGEPELDALAQRLAGMKPPRFLSLWEGFCQIVPFQQVSLSAAVATLNRFVAALGPRIRYDGLEYWGIPAPERVLAADNAELRACGLSAVKSQTLRRLAELELAGELTSSAFDAMPDEVAITRLTRIQGIGPWSAQVALLRVLGRLSVFPSGDSGAARGLRELLAQSEQPEIAASALLARMGDWRGYLYFMLLGRRLLATAQDAR